MAQKQKQGFNYIEEGVVQADVSIRIDKKRFRERPLFYRQDGETKQQFERRISEWKTTWKAKHLDTPKNARTRTVQELVTDFLSDDQAPNVKKRKRPISERTRSKYTNDLKNFLSFCVTKEIKYVAQITHDKCNAYFTFMQSEGYAAATIRADWKTLRAMFEYERSKRDSALICNPTSEIDPPADADELDEVVPFEEREVQIILSLVSTDRHRDAMIILRRSGLRISELAALPIKHIQFVGEGARETVLIEVRDYRRFNGTRYTPKTKTSKRTVPIVAPDAIAAIKRLLARNQRGLYLLEATPYGQTHTDLKGTQSVGITWLTNEFDRVRRVLIAKHPEYAARFLWLRTDGKCKSYWLSGHTFRKTFACDMLDAGLSLAQVGTLLGHASEYMTRKYARFSKGASLSLGEQMRSALLQGVPGPSNETSDTLSHAQRDTKWDTEIRNMAKIAQKLEW